MFARERLRVELGRDAAGEEAIGKRIWPRRKRKLRW